MAQPRDERPALWIGHSFLAVNDVPASTTYWVNLGMRELVARDEFAVLELRGGTHLVLRKADAPVVAGTPCPFDVMVDDIDATRKAYDQKGLAPSAMKVGNIHSSFTVTDPSGYEITVNSTHVGDLPV